MGVIDMHQNAQPQGQPKLVITISMAPNGDIEVNGAIQNKVIAYGMLQSAMDAVRQFIEDQQKLVQPAGPGHMAALAQAEAALKKSGG